MVTMWFIVTNLHAGYGGGQPWYPPHSGGQPWYIRHRDACGHSAGGKTSPSR